MPAITNYGHLEQWSTIGDRLGFIRRSGFNVVRHSRCWQGRLLLALPY